MAARSNLPGFRLGLAALVLGLPFVFGAGHAAAQQTTVPIQIVSAFDALFAGPHAGMRAVHAKGVLCEGVFIPAQGAAAISRAAHFTLPETPVVVRFSNFPGAPTLADGDPLASPRGLAIKFRLPDGETTDLVAHSYNGFPAATPEDFLSFLQALARPATLGGYLAGHAAAKTFIDAPKPPPESYATESFFGVSALVFSNAENTGRAGRYRIMPVEGTRHLTQDEAARRPHDYLAMELQQRLAQGPVEFQLLVQLAAPDDDVANGAVAWPDNREMVMLGTLRLSHFVPDSAAAQTALLFTPMNLVDGISPSADPMLLARTRAYRFSGERRGAAEDQ